MRTDVGITIYEDEEGWYLVDVSLPTGEVLAVDPRMVTIRRDVEQMAAQDAASGPAKGSDKEGDQR